MKEKLQEFALIAEVIGGIAVIVTLVFLVVETRENTNAIQAQTYQSLTSELNESRRSERATHILQVTAKLADNGMESLTGLEWAELMFWNESKWGVYESAFYAYRRGILGDDEWMRFESAICRNRRTDIMFWYPERFGTPPSDIQGFNLASNLTPGFTEFVEQLCP